MLEKVRVGLISPPFSSTKLATSKPLGKPSTFPGSAQILMYIIDCDGIPVGPPSETDRSRRETSIANGPATDHAPTILMPVESLATARNISRCGLKSIGNDRLMRAI